jgi:prolyl 4-hydroxylase
VVSTGLFFVHDPAMQTNPIAAAQAMLAAGRQGDAIALIGQAAAAGDVEARFQQALWRLSGFPLPRDLPRARMDLRAASAGGHAEARIVEIALTANGSGARADWPTAMQLLDAAAATSDVHALHLQRLIARMNLTMDGHPKCSPTVTPLVPDGTVRAVSALLDRDECTHVANSAADLLAPAVVADPRTGRSIPHPIRTSDAALISPVREDPVTRAINMRLAAVSGTHVDQGEALTVLRYRPGQQFRLHSDALPNVRNQRIATVLVYLNDGFGGGETLFPDHKLTVVPKAGDALIFDNVDAAGRPMNNARHAGAPVTSGVKWLATRWIRARPFDVWTGPEAA